MKKFFISTLGDFFSFNKKHTFVKKIFMKENQPKKASFFKQFYSGYYSLLFGFLLDIFNIFKENFNKKDVTRIKEETYQKR